MHEVSICESIIDILEEHAVKEGASRVTYVRLKVGEMAGVVEDALRFSFEIVAKGTVAEGCELVVDLVPLTALCRSCGGEFSVSGYAFSCPCCGSGEIDIVTGRELLVYEIDLQ